jgi:hypothetical protein
MRKLALAVAAVATFKRNCCARRTPITAGRSIMGQGTIGLTIVRMATGKRPVIGPFLLHRSSSGPRGYV